MGPGRSQGRGRDRRAVGSGEEDGIRGIAGSGHGFLLSLQRRQAGGEVGRRQGRVQGTEHEGGR